MSDATDITDGAVGRVRRYVEMRAAKPLRGVGECIHRVHTGTEWEAELLLSDLRALLAERDEARRNARAWQSAAHTAGQYREQERARAEKAEAERDAARCATNDVAAFLTGKLTDAEAERDRLRAEVEAARRESEAAAPVIEAARCIKHWHDREPDGMVVSAEHVRALWDVLDQYDAAIRARGDA